MVVLWYYDINTGYAFEVGFHETAEKMFKFVWGADPAKEDQQVLKECNENKQIWYTKTDVEFGVGIVYHSSFEKLKVEINGN